ncbi:MAG: hypothetical protein ABIS50_19985 [Luteolibacter sp.]|uniref:hypothetical protein n=1 Tax=Luteolibacter sp. TaxID=1962973 RepID=UPI0032655D9B
MDQTETASELRTASQMAAIYGVSPSTFTLWYDKRIVPGEFTKSRCPRFDPERVAKALKQYARENPQQHPKSKVPKDVG